MKTAVIIVNCHNQPLTIHFVKNELGKVSEELSVVIVNNDATRQSDGELVTALNAELVNNEAFRTSASDIYVISYCYLSKNIKVRMQPSYCCTSTVSKDFTPPTI